MFHVPVQFWAQYATLHFQGNTALWLQTFEAQHTVDNWVELCIAIDTKFGKDLYHNYMKSLLSIRQLGEVQEYYEQFQNAVHKVLAHNSNYDDRINPSSISPPLRCHDSLYFPPHPQPSHSFTGPRMPLEPQFPATGTQ